MKLLRGGVGWGGIGMGEDKHKGRCLHWGLGNSCRGYEGSSAHENRRFMNPKAISYQVVLLISKNLAPGFMMYPEPGYHEETLAAMVMKIAMIDDLCYWPVGAVGKRYGVTI